jgi:hypothetical protein
MKLKHLYLGLALVGLALPYSQLVPYLLDSGQDVVGLLLAPFSSRATAVFGFDLAVSAVAFLVWLIAETRRGKVRLSWLPIIVLFAVGLSMALPLFLYLREIQNEHATADPDTSPPVS